MKALPVLLLVLLLAACAPASNSIVPVTSVAATVTPSGEASQPAPTPTLLARITATQGVMPTATPTPLDVNLPEGAARDIAAATDAAMRPVIENPIVFDEATVEIKFDEFYNGYNLRTGLVLSDKLLSLDGLSVEMSGYMAPPLKPELDYFVLTRIRLAFCPFCTSGADWPDDIALVYLNNDAVVATERPVRIVGRMEVGASIDQETGMVSLVRIYADTLEIIQ